MKSLPSILTIVSLIISPICAADEKQDSAGATEAKNKSEPTQARALLEKGLAANALPEGMVVRLSACLGSPTAKAPGNPAPDLIRESWEFSSGQVRSVKLEESDDADEKETSETRPFNTQHICKALLEGKALEINEQKGKGPEIAFIGTEYKAGSRSLELVWKGKTILSLGETNGPMLMRYRESDARAFGALYEKLAGQARTLFREKTADTK